MPGLSPRHPGIRLPARPESGMGLGDLRLLLGLSTAPGSLSGGPPMCGRYTLKTPVKRLAEKFRLTDLP